MCEEKLKAEAKDKKEKAIVGVPDTGIVTIGVVEITPRKSGIKFAVTLEYTRRRQLKFKYLPYGILMNIKRNEDDDESSSRGSSRNSTRNSSSRKKVRK